MQGADCRSRGLVTAVAARPRMRAHHMRSLLAHVSPPRQSLVAHVFLLPRPPGERRSSLRRHTERGRCGELQSRRSWDGVGPTIPSCIAPCPIPCVMERSRKAEADSTNGRSAIDGK